MRALVTGAPGFIGRHLTALLGEQGVEVWTLGIEDGGAAHCRVADVTSRDELARAVERCRPDHVFHLAGVTRSESWPEFYRVNTAFTAVLLAVLQQSLGSAVRVLLVGSAAEYGDVPADRMPITEDTEPQPVTHYGISKLAQTHVGLAAARRGLHVVLARPFNLIGVGMADYLVLQSFSLQLAAIMKGKAEPVIRTGNLDRWRDFLDVEQAVQIFWDLIRHPESSGVVINVCSGVPTRISELLQRLIALTGNDIRVESDPSRSQPTDVERSWGSTARLEKFLGRGPRPFGDDLLRKVLEHCLARVGP